MAEFENMDHRLDKINATLKEYGMGTLDDAEKVCKEAGMDPLRYDIVKSVQPICFEDAAWAYTAGAAIAIKKGDSQTAEAVQMAMQKLMDDGTYTKILQHWGVESGALDKAEINPAVE